MEEGEIKPPTSVVPASPDVQHEEKLLGTTISKDDLEFTDAGFRYKIKTASGDGETENTAGDVGTMSELCRVKTWRYAIT